MTYHDHSDLRFMRQLRQNAPAAFGAFEEMTRAALDDETNPIPGKYAELMALAVTLCTQCPYCIEDHSKKAKAAGATSEELAQTVMIVSALRAGAGMAHGLMATKFFEHDSSKN
ncbi:MAG TPA: carboxymuconolactone decarboxylase family protein [Amycolatopsis sp.]|nr:carboxymuconolactone decarboxylase family protein [Amycolatopsis sp.]